MRASIVGAGIAGPVLGLFLKRAGMKPCVLEARASAASDEGAFLGIAPNGMNVLAELGLADAVLARGTVSQRFRFLNSQGATIGAIDQRLDRASYGQPMVMIKRADLHDILVEAARHEGVEVRWNARMASIHQHDDHVELFTLGGESVRSDVLLGCDGLRSRTRALVFPDAPALDYTGLLDFGGFTRVVPGEPLEVGSNVMMFGKRAFFGAFATERGELWWFHNGGEDAPLFELAPESRRQRLLAEHEGDPPFVRAIIARTETILGPWPLHVVPELPTWHTARVCLLGDAAHAMSPSAGQGASLALEDASVLARCLAAHAVPHAFAEFERLRRPRVAEIATQARRNSSGKARTSALSAWFRDRMLSTFLKLGAGAARRAYAYRVTSP